MNIEEKLSELGIDKILVVDDREENIQAAKECFSNMPAETNYASSAKEAITKLQESLPKAKYNLVITDLEMETPKAGLDVVKEALSQILYTTIATGKNYHMSDDDNHGPNTSIIPTDKGVKGKKDKPEVWKEVLDITLDYISSEEQKRIYKSAKRYEEFVGKTPELFTEYMLQIYKGEKNE